VGVDGGLGLLGVERGLPRFDVDTRLARELGDAVPNELVLVGREQEIVQLPDLALLLGGDQRSGDQLALLVSRDR
jgi:hypothetical protein